MSTIWSWAAGLLALGFVDFPLLAFHFQKNSLTKPEVIPLLYAGAMGVNGLTALIFGLTAGLTEAGHNPESEHVKAGRSRSRRFRCAGCELVLRGVWGRIISFNKRN